MVDDHLRKILEAVINKNKKVQSINIIRDGKMIVESHLPRDISDLTSIMRII